jgi:hypothetical protein
MPTTLSHTCSPKPGWWERSSWLQALSRVLKQALHLEHWWIMALLGVVAVHSMLEYPLWYTYFLGIVAILLGMAGEHRMWPLQKVAVLSAVILFSGMLNLATLWSNYRDLEQLAPSKIMRLDEPAIENILVQSEGDPVLRPYAEFVAASGIPWNTDSINDRLALNTRVMHFAPAPDVLYREAVLLALSGQRQAAIEQLAAAFRVYPTGLTTLRSELQQQVGTYPSELAPLLELATTKLRSTDPHAH